MRWISKTRLRIRSLFRKDRVDRELNDELRYHLDELVEHYQASGMTLADARYVALREMGPIEVRKEECRDARGVALIDSIRQDIGYAFRALRKSPAFTAVAVVSLAIGIGANTTVFTFLNAVLLRPLPYPDANRIVVLHEHKLESNELLSVHPVNFVEWRARARSFEALALVQAPPLNVIGRDGAEQVNRMATTAELFEVFGVRPALGRIFSKDETRPGGPRVVVLGYGFWQRWFGGDPTVLGRQLSTADGSLTIVGVAPSGFRIGLDEPDVFTAMGIDPARASDAGSRAFDCYGRLAPGADLDGARAEISTLASRMRKDDVIDAGMTADVSRLQEYLARDARPLLKLLMAVVAVVLAIACANLAGLLIARGMARRGELAVRVALGASRWRLVRQLIIESLVLSLAGGAAGVAAAYWTTQALAARIASAMGDAAGVSIHLDLRCLVFTLVICVATALAFGLLPARQASRVDPQAVLREQHRGATAGRGRFHVREALVIAEVTLAFVLLVGAGLLLRSLTNLTRVTLGFQPEGVVSMSLFLGIRPAADRGALVDHILDRIDAVPGVKAVGTVQFLPFRGMTCGTGFWPEAEAVRQDPSRTLSTECYLVSRGYFGAMGIPLRSGRAFDRRDDIKSERVLIVNEAFARHYFPDGDAVGRRILVQASNQKLATIVGVVGDVHHTGLTSDPAPAVYLVHAQTPGYITNLVVRSVDNPLAQASAIVRAIHEVDPSQAVGAPLLVEQDLERVLSRPRLQAGFVTSFALIAVLLAIIGIYGLVAYVVRLRTHEIGIRMALGATQETVFIELFGRGGRLVFVGIALGVIAAIALRQVASTLVFGVSPLDPLTYLGATLAFALLAFAAISIPIRRASRIEPMRALQIE
ncbi:MAG TPA: ABC transporter permease [Gemmatimonadaceae bacterium]|nr:ABC transporter permease [Gemmatimonadaceae bacterium]